MDDLKFDTTTSAGFNQVNVKWNLNLHKPTCSKNVKLNHKLRQRDTISLGNLAKEIKGAYRLNSQGMKVNTETLSSFLKSDENLWRIYDKIKHTVASNAPVSNKPGHR